MKTSPKIRERLAALEPGEQKLLRFLLTEPAVVKRSTFLMGLRKQFLQWAREPGDYPSPFSHKQWQRLVNTYIGFRRYRELLREIGP